MCEMDYVARILYGVRIKIPEATQTQDQCKHCGLTRYRRTDGDERAKILKVLKSNWGILFTVGLECRYATNNIVYIYSIKHSRSIASSSYNTAPDALVTPDKNEEATVAAAIKRLFTDNGVPHTALGYYLIINAE